jgi:hypothetical protein
MDPYHGYWIMMIADATLTVEGTRVSAGTPLELRPGWNYVSFLPEDDLPIAQALQTIDGLYIEVRGFDGGAQTYIPVLLPYMNTLSTMRPGKGYMIRMLEPGVLTYPEAESSP